MHLGAVDHIVPDGYKKVLSTLDKICALAQSRRVTSFVLLGDVFNTPDADDDHMLALIALFRRYPDIFFHIIVGNHDKASIKKHSLKILQRLGKWEMLNCTVYTSPKIVSIDGEKYFMCPHPFIEDAPNGVRYAFGHYGYKGARSDTGYVINKGAAPAGRWILGDFHHPQRGKGYIYAGSLCQVKWFEDPKKGFIELDDEPRFVNWTPDLRLGKREITDPAQLKELDPEVYWEIKVTAGVKLPTDWASRYPYIVRHSIDKIPTKRAQILMQRNASQNPLTGLSEYLRASQKFSDSDLRVAAKILKLDTVP